MRLTLKASINNEFRVGIESDPIYGRRFGDRAEQREVEKRARKIAEYERLSAIIRGAEVTQTSTQTSVSTTEQLALPYGTQTCLATQTSTQTSIDRTCHVADVRAEGRIIVAKIPAEDLEARATALRPLTLSKNFNKPPKAKWGRDFKAKSFSRYARHSILEAGAWLDRELGKERLCEITLTLPGDTEEAKRGIAQWSGWIVNRLTQVIRNQEKHEDIHHFFVWELQVRGALHMHWCVAAPSPLLAYLISEQIKDKWYALLLELERRTGINFFLNSRGQDWKNRADKWQWRVVPIKKSVAAYYSKYLGKSAALIDKKKRWKAGSIYYPSRWWGISRKLNQEIKKWRISLELPMLLKTEASMLEEQVCSWLRSQTSVCSSYSYEYCVTSSLASAPFASGKVGIFYCDPADTIQILNYLKAMRSCLSFATASDSIFAQNGSACTCTSTTVTEIKKAILLSPPKEVFFLQEILQALTDQSSRIEFLLDWASSVLQSWESRNSGACSVVQST